MKQLGNLAVVCAQRKDVLLEIRDKSATVCVGGHPPRVAHWDDDEKISEIIHELNFGSLKAPVDRSVNDLAQLKSRLIPGAVFEIVGYGLSTYIGPLRQVTKADQDRFYAVVVGQPEHGDSRENGGLGYSFWWRSDPFWAFRDGVCSLYRSMDQHDDDHLIVAFKIKEAI